MPIGPRITVMFILGLSLSLSAQSRAPDSTRTVAVPTDTASTPSDSIGAADTSADSLSSRGRKGDRLDTLRYEADEIHYDVDGKILHLWGNAVVRYQRMVLRADTIVYRINEDLFEAKGKPRLEEDKDVTVGEYMTYNIKTKRGRVRYATTEMEDAYFTGQQIVMSKERELYIGEGDYTTCAYLEDPHYFFYGRNIKIIPNDKAISRPVVLNIGSAPVAALPYFVLPLERGRRSGLLTPGWGGNPASGGYLDNVGYYWAPNDYADYMLAMKATEFQDFVFTGRGQYRLKYWLDGRINGRYALGTDYRQTSQNWALDYSHNQNLTPDASLRLTGRGSLVSNRTFYKAYSDDDDEILNQTITANMALSKRFDRTNSSLNASWNRTHALTTEHVTEDIPTVSYSLPNRPFIPHKPNEERADDETDEPKWYNNIYYSYSSRGVVKRDAYLNDSLGGWVRPGVTQSVGLSAPQKLFKWFTVSPSFSAQISNFYGYIDTTVRGYDTLYDTLSYVFDNPELDTGYADYVRIDTTEIVELDTLGEPDTLYEIRRRGPPRSFARYDTTWDQWRKDFSYRTGASLSTTLYGLFPVKIMNFVGMRHTFTPSVSYTFVPEHEQSKRFFPVGIPSAPPTTRKSQSIGIRAGNLFQGKIVKPADKAGEKPKETKFTILSADLSTAYDFEARSRKWSDLRLGASTTLKVVRITYSSSFWLYDERDRLSWPILSTYTVTLSPNNFSASGKLWDGDLLVLDSLTPNDPVEYASAGPQQWRLNLSPSYSFTKSRASPTDMFVPKKTYRLSASASVGFTRNWTLSWGSSYDFVGNRFTGHTVNLRCDLECWAMRFDWRPSGINPGYYFQINIKKLPEIKWQLRD